MRESERHGRLVLGWLAFLLGGLLLWSAYDGAGRRPPWPLGAVLPF